jgi:hypothetical protein
MESGSDVMAIKENIPRVIPCFFEAETFYVRIEKAMEKTTSRATPANTLYKTILPL